MDQIHRWNHVRVIAASGTDLVVEPLSSGEGVTIGWAPVRIPRELVPAALLLPNSSFWVASDEERHIVAVAATDPRLPKSP